MNVSRVLSKYYDHLSSYLKNYFLEYRSSVEKHKLTINSVEWEYYKAGSGPTLLLFHGGFFNGEMYFHQFNYFKSDYTVIAPTIPVVVQRFEDILTGIRKILEVEYLDDQKISVLGLSFGGMIAQLFLRKHTDIIDNVILSHTAVNDKKLMTKYKRLRPMFKILPWIIITLLFKRGASKKEWGINSEWKELVSAFFEEYFYTTFSKELVIARSHCIYDYRNYDLTPIEFDFWKGKMLILTTEDDTLQHLHYFKEIYPMVYEYCFPVGLGGHHTVFYYPDQYNAIVLEFLKGRMEIFSQLAEKKE
ncbi:MAG: alpha/beta hydrolase [Candidatus Hodarchaeales archaeon]|jgi:pimeloyl-ACP methyl ester carboxylesterase